MTSNPPWLRFKDIQTSIKWTLDLWKILFRVIFFSIFRQFCFLLWLHMRLSVFDETNFILQKTCSLLHNKFLWKNFVLGVESFLSSFQNKLFFHFFTLTTIWTFYLNSLWRVDHQKVVCLIAAQDDKWVLRSNRAVLCEWEMNISFFSWNSTSYRLYQWTNKCWECGDREKTGITRRRREAFFHSYKKHFLSVFPFLLLARTPPRKRSPPSNTCT